MRQGPQQAPQQPSGQQQAPQQPSQQPPTGYFRPTPPGTPPPVDATADTTHLRPITPDTPPPNPLANRLAGAPPQEGVTEQLPRIPAAVGESTQAHPGPLVDDDDDPFAGVGTQTPMESTQAHAGPYVDEGDEDYEYDYEQENAFSYAVDHDAAPAGVGGSLAVEDEEDGEEAEGSPAKQWLMMIAQLAIGVVGGAALWLGFQWLWNALPAAALAAAGSAFHSHWKPSQSAAPPTTPMASWAIIISHCLAGEPSASSPSSSSSTASEPPTPAGAASWSTAYEKAFSCS
ncbi:hypothetical protein [Kutzneria kofuensis]|uniref:hypothetical protein n=1 Tax=Kutzneria kofuensis TaxID=103725 RepID=UPI0031F0ABBE